MDDMANFRNQLVTLMLGLKVFERFWNKNPAFFLSLICLIATYLALNFNYLWVLTALTFLGVAYKRALLILTLATATYFFVSFLFPVQSFKKERGVGKITISEIQNVPTHYGKKKRALITIDHFKSENIEMFNQKAFFYCKNIDEINSNQLLAKGSLTQFAPHTYLFRASEIENLAPTFSLMKKRSELKGKLYKFLHKKMSHHFSADLLYALLSGEVVNMQLRMLFNRLGLGHLLAISGFHFSIVTGFLALFFVKSNRRFALIILITCATLYFLFVGGFASIKRAYLMLLVVLVGHYFSLRSSSINTLGSCLLILLIVDPILALSLGFQLSFLATASILLFYAPINNLLKSVLPSRNPTVAKKLGPLSFCGYIFASLLRKALAINIAVYILCFPYLLFLFNNFPVLSLYYNLFMPLVVATVMIGGVISLAIPGFFPILNMYSKTILSFLEHFPRFLDFSVSIYSMPSEILFYTLAPTAFLGIYFSQKHRENLFKLHTLLK